MVNFLRSLITIPVSIGFSIIYAIYVHPFLTQELDKKIANALSPLIVGIIAVVLTYIIAPKNKFKLALVVAGILLLAPISGIIIVIFGIEVSGQEQTVVDGGVAIAMLLVGIIAGIFIAWMLSSWHDILDTEDSRIIKRIAHLEGLEAMTVNDRLYASGLDEEFYAALKADKARARKILIWLKVDVASIDLIVKND